MATTVTVNLMSIFGANLSTNTFVRFTLRNYGRNVPRITSSGVLAKVVQEAYPDGSGLVTQAVDSNTDITPSGTYYNVEYFHQGTRTASALFLITGGSMNLNSASPITTTPVVTPPEGDTTYIRLDEGNINLALDPFHWSNDIYFKNSNLIRYASQFTGANEGAKIAAAIADLPSTGGAVFADFTGTAIITADIFSGVTKPVTLTLGATQYNTSATQNIPSNCSVFGVSGGAEFGTGEAGSTTGTSFVWTGSAGAGRNPTGGSPPNYIFRIRDSHHAKLMNVVLDGGGVANVAGILLDCTNASTTPGHTIEVGWIGAYRLLNGIQWGIGTGNEIDKIWVHDIHVESNIVGSKGIRFDGSNNGQDSKVTRLYTRLVDNGIDLFGKSAYMQFEGCSFGTPVSGVHGGAGVNDIAISSISLTSNVVTVNATAHGLQPEMLVIISSVSNSTFNGTFRVDTVPSSSQFTYAKTAGDIGAISNSGYARADISGIVTGATANIHIISGSSESNVSGASGPMASHDKPGRYFLHCVNNASLNVGSAVTVLENIKFHEPVLWEGTGKLVSIGNSTGTIDTVAITSIDRTSNVVTVTATTDHFLSVGDMVVIAGVTDTAFNGTFSVTDVTSTTVFKYAQTAGDVSSSSGTILICSAVVNGTAATSVTSIGDYVTNNVEGWVGVAGTEQILQLRNAQLLLSNGESIRFRDSTNQSNTAAITLTSANILQLLGLYNFSTTDISPASGNPTLGAAQPFGAATFAGTVQTNAGNFIEQSANGARWIIGQLSELVTLSGATTDSIASLLPINSIITSVVTRVTTTITGCTGYSVGDATTAARFINNNTQLSANSTAIGLLHMAGGVATDAAGPTQSAAAALRFTAVGGGASFSTGEVRVTVFYSQFNGPTS